MWKHVLTLAVCIALASTAPASEALEKAVAAVEEAAAREDTQALVELGSPTGLGAWLIADRLLAAGKRDAATALAEALDDADTAKLDAFVADFEETEADRVVREALARSRAVAREKRFDEAWTAIETAPTADNPVLRAELAYHRANLTNARGDAMAASDGFVEAARLSREAGWLRRAATAYHNAGLMLYRIRKLDGAIEPWRRRLDVERERRRPRDVAACSANLALVLKRLGRSEEALPIYEAAIEAIESADAPRTEIVVRRGHAELLKQMGRFDAARSAFERTVELSREADDAEGIASALSSLSQLDRQQGRLESSVALARQAVTVATEGSVPSERLRALEVLANALKVVGEFAEARKILQQCLESYADGDRPEKTAGAQINLAGVLRALGEHEAAIEQARAAAETFARIGVKAGELAARVTLGASLSSEGRFSDALTELERAVELAGAVGNTASLAAALSNRAGVLRRLGKPGRARADYLAAAELQRALGQATQAARSHAHAARMDVDTERYREAVRTLETSLAMLEAAGDAQGTSQVVGDLAKAHHRLGDLAEAQRYARRNLELARQGENPHSVASAMSNLAAILESAGEYTDGLRLKREALSILREHGSPRAVMQALIVLADTERDVGNLAHARTHGAEAVRLADELESALDRADARSSLANTMAAEGRLDVAIELGREAVDGYREAGEAAKLAIAAANQAGRHAQRGEIARALREIESLTADLLAVGRRAAAANVLLDVGGHLLRTHDLEGTRDCYTRAVKMAAELEVPQLEARCHAAMSQLEWIAGDGERALRHADEALSIRRAAGLREAVASSLRNRANALRLLGRDDEALADFNSALELARELGAQSAEQPVLTDLAQLHLVAGRLEAAADAFEAARNLARRQGAIVGEITALQGLAQIELNAGRHAAALELTDEALSLVPLTVAQLSDQRGASARARWSGVFEVGALAALATGDLPDAVRYVESGRASGLREALGVAAAVEGADVPAELVQRRESARRAAAAARKRLAHATEEKNLAAIRTANEAWNDAQRAFADAVASVERHERALAGSLSPQPAGVEELRDALHASDRLVLFASFEASTHALVLTRDDVRHVVLGPTQSLRDEIAALRADDPETSVSDSIAALRRRLIEPLALGEDVRRVLVSPDGALYAVPFAALLESTPLVHVPSGTTSAQLARVDPGASSATKILALGDPAYDARPDEQPVAALTRGRKLVRLPASGDEARSVGDVVFTGEEATETRLRDQLASETRWRAVHLACHGLVDVDRPSFSSLALAPEAGEDGYLTLPELSSLRVRADLVVLSACDTGRGRYYAGEGVVGLPRAFLIAGAPRVIVSAWKVDDKATAALMKHFYAAWAEPDRTAADALRVAQEHVRNTDGWEHPYYWAAWQLWGSGD